MDAGPLVLLGFGWLVVNAMRKAWQTPPGKAPPRPGPVPGRATTASGRATPPGRPAPRAAHGDPSQREGQQLETLLRQLERTLGSGAGPLGRRPDRPLPNEEQVEDRETLETLPRVRSLEAEPEVTERETVDYDEQAEQIIARRRAGADARSGPPSPADHAAFDRRIRQEPADKTATRAADPRRLREAVVWREILGPPVSLRGDAER
ncbi:MAG TPA: hypothetical protein VF046_03095 [Gemmatimonadales bacterium]